MTDTDPGREFTDGPRLLLVFLVWFLILTLLLALVASAVPDGIAPMLKRVTVILPILFAALLAGQSHGRKFGARVPNRPAWLLSLVYCLIVFSLWAIGLSIILPVAEIIAPLGSMFVGLAIFVFMSTWIATRVMLSLGARSAIADLTR